MSLSKICTRCNIEKSINDFYDSKYVKDGKENQCKKCRLDRSINRKELDRERKKLWQAKFKAENPDKVYNQARQDRYKRLYGITILDYYRMLKEQEEKCAICGTTEIKRKAFDVDHCHITKTVRGLLCNNCNRGLGHFQDNINILKNAIKYLNND